MRQRKANGQVRQTDTTSSATKLFPPMSQNGRSSTRPRSSTSTWLTSPVSRWNMNVHVITAAYTGSAYGVRNSVRSAPRPRNGRCSSTAAAMPRHQDRPTESTV
jgi:hypothetical protein